MKRKNGNTVKVRAGTPRYTEPTEDHKRSTEGLARSGRPRRSTIPTPKRLMSLYFYHAVQFLPFLLPPCSLRVRDPTLTVTCTSRLRRLRPRLLLLPLLKSPALTSPLSWDRGEPAIAAIAPRSSRIVALYSAGRLGTYLSCILH